MTVYALAQLKITDRRVYERYRNGFMRTLKPFGGRLLAADERPELVEGEWDGDKVVLIAFDCEAMFRAWMHSPEYERIAADRRAGSHGPVFLIKSV